MLIDFVACCKLWWCPLSTVSNWDCMCYRQTNWWRDSEQQVKPWHRIVANCWFAFLACALSSSSTWVRFAGVGLQERLLEKGLSGHADDDAAIEPVGLLVERVENWKWKWKWNWNWNWMCNWFMTGKWSGSLTKSVAKLPRRMDWITFCTHKWLMISTDYPGKTQMTFISHWSST